MDNSLFRGRKNPAPFIMDFYEESKWQKLRLSILRRDQYRCQLSKRYGKLRQAEIVHHIFPLSEFPEYAYEPWNLISITRTYHNRLHDRNTDSLTEEGAELLRRTARKQGIEIPEEYRKEIKRTYKHGEHLAYRFTE